MDSLNMPKCVQVYVRNLELFTTGIICIYVADDVIYIHKYLLLLLVDQYQCSAAVSRTA